MEFGKTTKEPTWKRNQLDFEDAILRLTDFDIDSGHDDEILMLRYAVAQIRHMTKTRKGLTD